MWFESNDGGPVPKQLSSRRLASRSSLALLAILVFGTHVADIQAAELWWVNSSAYVSHGNVDGSGATNLGQFHNGSLGIAVDTANGYFYKAGVGKVVRAELDGSGVTDFVTSSGIYGATLDTSNNHLYFSSNTGLNRINLDGTGQINLVSRSQTSNIYDIELDLTNGYIYWGAVGSTIRRSDLDGSNVTQFSIGSLPTIGYNLALDAVDQMLYWTTLNNQSIAAMKTDGSGQTMIVSEGEAGTGRGIEVDHDAGKIYWSVWNEGIIRSADLDGSNITDVYTSVDGVNNPWGLTLAGASETSSSVPLPPTYAIILPMLFGVLRARRGISLR